MLYDVAIALNDWCSDADGVMNGQRARALLGAYAGYGGIPREEAGLAGRP